MNLASLRRWFAGAALASAALVAFTVLWSFYARNIHGLTGGAEWIWIDRPLAEREPVTFFATKNFRVPKRRQYAKIRIAGDPWYTLYVNETEVGSGGWAARESIDEWDVTELVRDDAVNRVVVACRSADGVGGLLVSIDFGPMMGAVVVSGNDWHLYGARDEMLLARDPVSGREPVAVLGRPPVGKWNYPPLQVQKPRSGISYTRLPVSRTEVEAAVPVIEVIGGVAIAGRSTGPATLFDFGREVFGRPRLLIQPGTARAIPVRVASQRFELDEVAPPMMISAAASERVVDMPEPQSFRYLLVYTDGVEAAVVTDSPG